MKGIKQPRKVELTHIHSKNTTTNMTSVLHIATALVNTPTETQPYHIQLVDHLLYCTQFGTSSNYPHCTESILSSSMHPSIYSTEIPWTAFSLEFMKLTSITVLLALVAA